MKIELYYAPVTCALVPYVTLTEAGAEFEVHPLDFGREQHRSPEYLALNPKHKVPLLVVDGRKLTENVAIQQWIARAFPEAGLLPEDPWRQLEAVSMLSWCSGGIHPFLSRINAPARVCELEEATDGIRRVATAAVGENFAIAEALLDGRDWFFERFTAADAHFFWCFRRATQFGLDLDPYARCREHFGRMHERDSVRRLLAFEEKVLAGFSKAA